MDLLLQPQPSCWFASTTANFYWLASATATVLLVCVRHRRVLICLRPLPESRPVCVLHALACVQARGSSMLQLSQPLACALPKRLVRQLIVRGRVRPPHAAHTSPYRTSVCTSTKKPMACTCPSKLLASCAHACAALVARGRPEALLPRLHTLPHPRRACQRRDAADGGEGQQLPQQVEHGSRVWQLPGRQLGSSSAARVTPCPAGFLLT